MKNGKTRNIGMFLCLAVDIDMNFIYRDKFSTYTWEYFSHILIKYRKSKTVVKDSKNHIIMDY